LVGFNATFDVSNLEDHFCNAPEDATYMSYDSSSEFITITGEYIERKLLEALRSARYFTFLAEESSNAQNKEQISVPVFIK